MNYKLFKEKPYNAVPAAFAPKPGDLVVSIDPDNKLPVEKNYLVGHMRENFILQLGVFWDLKSAKIFANALNRGQIEKIADAAFKKKPAQ